jgi:hypothetical protein
MVRVGASIAVLADCTQARRVYPLQRPRRRRDAMPCAEPNAGSHQPDMPDLTRPGRRWQPLGPHRRGALSHNRAGSSTMTGIWRVVFRS